MVTWRVVVCCNMMKHSMRIKVCTIKPRSFLFVIFKFPISLFLQWFWLLVCALCKMLILENMESFMQLHLLLFLLLRELLSILLMWTLMLMEFLLRKELPVHMVLLIQRGLLLLSWFDKNPWNRYYKWKDFFLSSINFFGMICLRTSFLITNTY